MTRKVHFIASGAVPRGPVTTSCLKTSAGGGIGGGVVLRFAERRNSMSAPVRDFDATQHTTLVTCARCLAHL